MTPRVVGSIFRFLVSAGLEPVCPELCLSRPIPEYFFLGLSVSVCLRPCFGTLYLGSYIGRNVRRAATVLHVSDGCFMHA